MDVSAKLCRAYAFSAKRIRRFAAMATDKMYLMSNAEVEDSSLDYTWITNDFQLKLTDSTEFSAIPDDPSFPSLSWDYVTISAIAENPQPQTIGLTSNIVELELTDDLISFFFCKSTRCNCLCTTSYYSFWT